jgi:hypothetical protein
MELCNKTSFADQKLAQEYMMHIFFEKNRRRITPNRTYLCPNCNAWHLSSNGKNDYVYELKIKHLQDKIEELSLKKKIDNNQNNDKQKLDRKLKSEESTILKRDKQIEKLQTKLMDYKERLNLLRSKEYVIDKFFAILSTEKDLDVLNGIQKYISEKIVNISNSL